MDEKVENFFNKAMDNDVEFQKLIHSAEKQWFDIEGSIEVDVDEETFNSEFLKWAESKGWSFVGIIKPTEDE